MGLELKSGPWVSLKSPGPVDTNQPVRRLGFRCQRPNSCHAGLRPLSMAFACSRSGSRSPSSEAGLEREAPGLRVLFARTSDRSPSWSRKLAIRRRALWLTVGYGCKRHHPSRRTASHRAQFTQAAPFTRPGTPLRMCCQRGADRQSSFVSTAWMVSLIRCVAIRGAALCAQSNEDDEG